MWPPAWMRYSASAGLADVVSSGLLGGVRGGTPPRLGALSAGDLDVERVLRVQHSVERVEAHQLASAGCVVTAVDGTRGVIGAHHRRTLVAGGEGVLVALERRSTSRVLRVVLVAAGDRGVAVVFVQGAVGGPGQGAARVDGAGDVLVGVRRGGGVRVVLSLVDVQGFLGGVR